MTEDFLSISEKEVIPRKLNLVLLFDTSYSMADKDPGMQNSKIFELNRVFQKFVKFLETNNTARSMCDIVIMTFGANEVNVVSSYDPIEKLKKIRFVPIGNTPMCEAIKKAHDYIKIRKQYYEENKIDHYRPSIVLITDGEATDYQKYESFAKDFKFLVTKRKINFFPYCLGLDDKLEALKAFSPDWVHPRIIKGQKGMESLYQYLIHFFDSNESMECPDESKDPWEGIFANGEGETV